MCGASPQHTVLCWGRSAKMVPPKKFPKNRLRKYMEDNARDKIKVPPYAPSTPSFRTAAPPAVAPTARPPGPATEDQRLVYPACSFKTTRSWLYTSVASGCTWQLTRLRSIRYGPTRAEKVGCAHTELPHPFPVAAQEIGEVGLVLLEHMLNLDPRKRTSSKEAAYLSPFFTTHPKPCHPSQLPKFEARCCSDMFLRRPCLANQQVSMISVNDNWSMSVVCGNAFLYPPPLTPRGLLKSLNRSLCVKHIKSLFI